ncbi:MAG: hypothetical protein KDB85_12210, partial [Chitinophagales bacterium]|nr:hypothetical protein [Chitinophagales bacterium]
GTGPIISFIFVELQSAIFYTNSSDRTTLRPWAGTFAPRALPTKYSTVNLIESFRFQNGIAADIITIKHSIPAYISCTVVFKAPNGFVIQVYRPPCLSQGLYYRTA